jgi:hypothetical protein
LIHVSRIPWIHPKHLAAVNGALIITIAPAYAGHTTDAGLVVVKAKFTSGTGVEATSATDVAGVIACRGELVPLQRLQGGVLCKECCGENEVTSRLAIHARNAGHDEWLGNGLKVAGRLLLLLLFSHDAVALLRLFIE